MAMLLLMMMLLLLVLMLLTRMMTMTMMMMTTTTSDLRCSIPNPGSERCQYHPGGPDHPERGGCRGSPGGPQPCPGGHHPSRSPALTSRASTSDHATMME